MMRCTACGEELKGSRCPFCGYKITEADIRAGAAWEKQKSEMGAAPVGPDWKGERPSLPVFKKRSGSFGAEKQRRMDKDKKTRMAAAKKHSRKQEPARPSPEPTPCDMPFLAKAAIFLWVVFSVLAFLQAATGQFGIVLF